MTQPFSGINENKEKAKPIPTLLECSLALGKLYNSSPCNWQQAEGMVCELLRLRANVNNYRQTTESEVSNSDLADRLFDEVSSKITQVQKIRESQGYQR